MRINWRKTTFIVLDTVLAVYLVLAITSFNRPEFEEMTCQAVDIDIADGASNGFLTTAEIKSILEKKHLFPLGKPLRYVNPREIEDVLKVSPFVSTAQCYKTEEGHVCVSITQRMPIVRIKSQTGDDYYIDDKGGIMPNSSYISDLIIATGDISRWFAERYVSLLSQYIMEHDLWKNQVEQINVLPDKGIELVPRVGDHVIHIGQLPESKFVNKRRKEVYAFLDRKFSRLMKFYLYGLSKAGWNRYSYIDLQFDNQIICKRRGAKAVRKEEPMITADYQLVENTQENARQDTNTAEQREKTTANQPDRQSRKDGQPQNEKPKNNE